MAGLASHWSRGHRILQIELTSSDEALWWDLNRAFQILVKRIRRKYGYFEYWALKTDEGNGVINVLAYSPYIPQKWLSEQWAELHGSPIVFIQEVNPRRGRRRVARYMCGYMAHHRLSWRRQSWSHGWVFHGWVGYWKSLCKKARRWRMAIVGIIPVWEHALSLRYPKPYLERIFLRSKPPPIDTRYINCWFERVRV